MTNDSTRLFTPQCTRDTYLDQKPYLYCEHDPVNNLDSTGHLSWRDVGGFVAAAVVAVGITVAIGIIGAGTGGTGLVLAPVLIDIGVGAIGGFVGGVVKSQIDQDGQPWQDGLGGALLGGGSGWLSGALAGGAGAQPMIQRMIYFFLNRSDL